MKIQYYDQEHGEVERVAETMITIQFENGETAQIADRKIEKCRRCKTQPTLRFFEGGAPVLQRDGLCDRCLMTPAIDILIEAMRLVLDRYDACALADNSNIAEIFAKMYPFPKSFDEMLADVREWKEDVDRFGDVTVRRDIDQTLNSVTRTDARDHDFGANQLHGLAAEHSAGLRWRCICGERFSTRALFDGHLNEVAETGRQHIPQSRTFWNAAGFALIETGGGCTAYRRDYHEGYVMITDNNVAAPGQLDETHLVGFYPVEGEEEGDEAAAYFLFGNAADALATITASMWRAKS